MIPAGTRAPAMNDPKKILHATDVERAVGRHDLAEANLQALAQWINTELLADYMEQVRREAECSAIQEAFA